MARQQILVLLTVLSLMFRNISSQQCKVDTYSIYQMMLKGHTFKTFKARPLSTDCIEACDSDVRCQSINYVMFKGICELNNRTKEARPGDFIKNRDRYYMTKAPDRAPLGSVPELPADSCGEIKASEGERAPSGNYWLDPTRSGNSILFPCHNMESEIPFQCPLSWIGFEESCYRRFTDEKDWNNADASCKAYGAQLVKIESAEENDFINKEFLAGDGDYWIGLTDAETENVWKWSDGNQLTGYTNWMYNQPNDYEGQDCGRIKKGYEHSINKYYDGEWHDDKCSLSIGYICEK